MNTQKCLVFAGMVTLISGLACNPIFAQEVGSYKVDITDVNSFDALLRATSDRSAKDAIILLARQVPATSEAARKVPTSFDIDFEGAGFDAGISVLIPVGSTPVREAVIRNNKVVVTKADNMSVVPVLQLHYFFEREDKTKTYGQGPFLAVGLDQDKILKSLAVGWMVGFRKSKESPLSINVGAGLYVAPNTSVLASDFKDGQAAPEGAKEVETVEKAVGGLSVTVSLKF